MHQDARIKISPKNEDSTERKWTFGPKNGIGTSFYEPSMGQSLSNVWYTLSNGILTEVFYPDVGTPNLLSFQFAITDGQTFLDFEDEDMVHETKLAYHDALIYQQTNTAKTGLYQLVKTFVTNPDKNALIIRVQMHLFSEVGTNYQRFLAINTAISGTPFDDELQVIEDNGVTYLAAFDAETAMVISSSHTISIPEQARIKGGRELSWMAALADKDKASLGKQFREWTICIGFGESVKEAIQSAKETMSQSFLSIMESYCDEWKKYIKRFHPPDFVNHHQYLASLMIMKAHEDKRQPGAIVASFSTPWEPIVTPMCQKLGGYHLIWARDLCHIGSAFAVAGDMSIALRILHFLDDKLQTEDGSFPQNAWPDGTAQWTGQQLDQTAFPILLAYQLEQTDCYETLVKPAADYLVAHGPITEQERWEENQGYSPSTLAVEIAALVVAAHMARLKDDFDSAERYLITADCFERAIERWVVTKCGKLSTTPYYIRVSGTDNPDDGEWVSIKNGGLWRDKTEVIDAGFLELVRLGIRRADDPLIIHSLSQVDEHLCYESSVGPVWRRYTYDGYGEQVNGLAYNGAGVGRPWPLLTGERGEFEIAWLNSSKSIRPKRFFGPVALLYALSKTANDGFMIPEQIWDEKSVPEERLFTDLETHSASPLVWALAEYIRLAECIRQQRVVTMPQPVYQRYAGSSQFKIKIPIADFVNDASCSLVEYPKASVFYPGDFELQRISMYAIGQDIHFKIYLGHLDNPWDGPNGISKQIIDIYLNTNLPSAQKAVELKDVNACFDSKTGWVTLIRITGDWAGDSGVYTPSGSFHRGVFVFTELEENVVHAIVNSSAIGGMPKAGWEIAVTIAGEHQGQVRDVKRLATDWAFGRCFPHNSSLVTDFLEPVKGRKQERFQGLERKVTEIPLICI